MLFSEWLQINEGKKDACYHKVKRRVSVWPSAYASGMLVQCRKKGAKNWGNSSKKKKRKKKKVVREVTETKLITFQNFMESKFKLEKERGLRGWFDRNNGKGWIDCKASKKGKLVACGRKKAGAGAERKYPACRPTLSACNSSKHKKKSSKPISWKKKKSD